MNLRPDPPFEAQGTNLLCSPDPPTIELVRDVFAQYLIHSDVADREIACRQMLNTKRFESVVVDFSELEHASDVLTDLRCSLSNSNSVAFAIASNEQHVKAAIRSGCNFVVKRPLLAEGLEQVLRAAYGIVFRERRRYFRCPITEVVSIHRNGRGSWKGRLVNVSEGGTAINADLNLQIGESVLLSFTVPDSSSPISTDAEVCWKSNSTLMGFKFLEMDPTCVTLLQSWLSEQLEKRMPDALVEKLRASVLPLDSWRE